jgi:hypothetical protein
VSEKSAFPGATLKETANRTKPIPPCAPWWCHGHVWLLIAGPGRRGVCRAGHGWIAVRGADPVVAQDYYRARHRDQQGRRPTQARLPALQGRKPRTPRRRGPEDSPRVRALMNAERLMAIAWPAFLARPAWW